jgi:hypothetical protein
MINIVALRSTCQYLSFLTGLHYFIKIGAIEYNCICLDYTSYYEQCIDESDILYKSYKYSGISDGLCCYASFDDTISGYGNNKNDKFISGFYLEFQCHRHYFYNINGVFYAPINIDKNKYDELCELVNDKLCKDDTLIDYIFNKSNKYMIIRDKFNVCDVEHNDLIKI